jgi:FkbM family methyltransferase
MKLPKRRVEAVFLDTIRRGFWSPVPADAPVTHVLDLGANVGLFSVFARMRWPNAWILAVEPDPAAYTMLEDNTRGLDIQCLHAAFGPVGCASVLKPDGRYFERHYAASDTGVPAFPLDVLLNMVAVDFYDPKVLLKIDIEGAEHQIIRDPDLGAKVLQQAYAIALEIHPPIPPFASWFAGLLSDTHTVTTLNDKSRSYVVHAVRKGVATP